MGRVVSVNLARPARLTRKTGTEETGIFKEPVAGAIHLEPEGIAGDLVADRSVHGGVDKAVYAYAREDYAWWSTELGRELGPGTFGENLTLEGIDPGGAEVGERWRIGSALLEVSEPRFPCWKLATKMEDPHFIKRFADARRSGTYLRVVEQGEVSAGDTVDAIERPGHGVTIALFVDAYLNERAQLTRLLEAPALSAAWRDWVGKRVA